MATVQGTFSGHPVSYDEDTAQWYSTSGSVENAYTDSSSTNYFQINLTRGSGAVTHMALNFDVSSIPANATIKSVTCTATCYCSNTQDARVATRNIQLYSGDTAKGSAYTMTVSSTPFTITAGTWTRAELNNAKIVLHCVRGTSSTTGAYYLRFYGATLTVTYEYDITTYSVTASSSVGGMAISPASGNPYKGTDYGLNITGSSDISNLVLIDNGVDVTSLIVGGETTVQTERYPSTATVSGTVTPSNSNYRPQDVVGHSVESPLDDGRSYWTFQGLSSVKYGFDFSSIPQGAVITGVEVRFAGFNYDNVKATLYSGSTQKGTSQDVLYYGDDLMVQSISNVGSWTRDELQNANIVFSNSSGYSDAYVGGVTWVVTYRVQSYTYTITNISGDHVVLLREGNKIFVKVNGSWKQADDVLVKVNGTWQSASSVFKKVNGSWVKQSDKSVMFDQDALFRYHEPYSSRVDYLQSTGTQYIELPCAASAGDYFGVSGYITPLYDSSFGNLRVFSADVANQFSANFYSYTDSNERILYSSTVGTVSASGGWSGYRNTKIYFEVSTTGKTSLGNFTELARPLTASITKLRIFGGFEGTGYPVRFHSFTIKKNDTILYNLIPVRVGQIGYMYDTISEKFYGNNGTGSFIVGNDI